MIKLIKDIIEKRQVQLSYQRRKHRLKEDKKKQVKATKDIQRCQTGCVFLR